jgi:hypothetical protein
VTDCVVAGDLQHLNGDPAAARNGSGGLGPARWLAPGQQHDGGGLDEVERGDALTVALQPGVR